MAAHRRSSHHQNQSDKWKSLPSLTVDNVQVQSSSLSELQFAGIAPVFRRSRFDLFGVGGNECVNLLLTMNNKTFFNQMTK